METFPGNARLFHAYARRIYVHAFRDAPRALLGAPIQKKGGISPVLFCKDLII